MNTTQGWQFASDSRTGRITATEPNGTQHSVARGDMNTIDGRNLLNAMTRDLTKPGFSDSGADIEARLLRDAKFLDCPACGGSGHVEDAAGRIVAYGIFADIPGEGWVLQFPNYATRADAERMAGLFTAGSTIEVRPLFA